LNPSGELLCALEQALGLEARRKLAEVPEIRRPLLDEERLGAIAVVQVAEAQI